jgi:preprotein translocase subunit Sec63
MTDKQFSSGNFYEVLGVDPNANQNEIKRMYQELVLKVGRLLSVIDLKRGVTPSERSINGILYRTFQK